MKKTSSVLFFGFGQVAQTIFHDLKSKNFKFFATNTTGRLKNKSYKKCFFLKFNSNVYDKKIKQLIEKIDYIIVSIAPDKKGDLVLKNFKESIKNFKGRKIIYLSSTAVYGDHAGAWVNESSTTKPKTSTGSKRLQAEKQWQRLKKQEKLPIFILRIAGIYSPKNNIVNRIIHSKILNLNSIQYISRIHINDLANIIIKIILKTKINRSIFNVADNQPLTPLESASIAVNFLGKKFQLSKFLKSLTINYSKNKIFSDSKRVMNDKLIKDLNYKLQFPNLNSGLINIFN